MFQHILVPLDGSPRAERALPVAARHTSGSLLLVQVIRPVDYSGGLAVAPLLSEQVVKSEMNDAADYLKRVARSPLLVGIPLCFTSASHGFSRSLRRSVIIGRKSCASWYACSSSSSSRRNGSSGRTCRSLSLRGLQTKSQAASRAES